MLWMWSLFLLPLVFGQKTASPTVCKGKCLGYEHVVQEVQDTVLGNLESVDASLQCSAPPGYSQPVMAVLFSEVTAFTTQYGVEILVGASAALEFKCDPAAALNLYQESKEKKRYLLNIWCVAGKNADQESTNTYRLNLWAQIQKKNITVKIFPELRSPLAADLPNNVLDPMITGICTYIEGKTATKWSRTGKLKLEKKTETGFNFVCTPAAGDNAAIVMVIYKQYSNYTKTGQNILDYRKQIVAAGDAAAILPVICNWSYRKNDYMYFETRQFKTTDPFKSIIKIWCNSYKKQEISLNNAKLSVYDLIDEAGDFKKLTGIEETLENGPE